MIFGILGQIVYILCTILIVVLLARSVLSWIVYSGNQYNPSLGRLFQALRAISEPIVAPVRRLLSRFVRPGPIDYAPVAAFFLIMIIRLVVPRILFGLEAL